MILLFYSSYENKNKREKEKVDKKTIKKLENCIPYWMIFIFNRAKKDNITVRNLSHNKMHILFNDLYIFTNTKSTRTSYVT